MATKQNKQKQRQRTLHDETVKDGPPKPFRLRMDHPSLSSYGWVTRAFPATPFAQETTREGDVAATLSSVLFRAGLLALRYAFY
jgi:hypothetical protein